MTTILDWAIADMDRSIIILFVVFALGLLILASLAIRTRLRISRWRQQHARITQEFHAAVARAKAGHGPLPPVPDFPPPFEIRKKT